MSYRLTYLVFPTLIFSLSAAAQGGKPSSGGTTSPNRISRPPQPSLNFPDSISGQRAFLTGKVVLDDGTQLTEPANIQTICGGRRQTVTHTDSHGGFSFELGDRASAMSSSIGEAADDTIGMTPSKGGGVQRNWRECELLAVLPGFSSQPIDLSSRLSAFESADIGRLVLHRMGQVQGFTISATSAMAPKDAQKAYTKGAEKARHEKWDEAEQSFARAVQIYPKYAVAWFDLGRIQLRNKAVVDARHSFEQSIAADSKYVNPYRGLAELDTQQQQWPALVAVTRQITALNPVSFPDAWFSNGLGNYYLHNFADAEKSARQGMKVDDEHQLPKLEYLLGLILIQEHQYAEAASHIQNFLKVAKRPGEIEDANKQLAEITRLSQLVSDRVGSAENK